MSALSLRLPDSIHRHIKKISKNEGVSINQFISTAVSEKISALLTEDYIKNRGKKSSPEKIQQILKKVKNREPLPGDEI